MQSVWVSTSIRLFSLSKWFQFGLGFHPAVHSILFLWKWNTSSIPVICLRFPVIVHCKPDQVEWVQPLNSGCSQKGNNWCAEVRVLELNFLNIACGYILSKRIWIFFRFKKFQFEGSQNKESRKQGGKVILII